MTIIIGKYDWKVEWLRTPDCIKYRLIKPDGTYKKWRYYYGHDAWIYLKTEADKAAQQDVLKRGVNDI